MRTRFAPSPTGFLHVGGLRTALYSFLIARKTKGSFLLRIEDTDQERSVPGTVENMLRALRWAWMDPDEGVMLTDDHVTQRGSHGPYIQSERQAQGLYKKYADQLLANNRAYRCFCTSRRLEEMRKKQETLHQAPMYDRTCLNISEEEVTRRVVAGEPHVIRLKIPHERTITFADDIRGAVHFQGHTVDDQVLLKSDGFPTYHLAHVVDDHLMEIDLVIRGEEWLSSLPKHLLLFEFLGWQPPRYAHVPLLLNADRTKLSKRQNAVAVEEYIQKGYLPEALINFLALLGWNPGTTQELFSMEELIEQFSLDRVQKAGAVFDTGKLDWLQGQWMRKIPLQEFASRILPLVREKYPAAAKDKMFEKKAALIQERITFFAKAPDMLSYFYEEPKVTLELLANPKQKVTAELLPKLLTDIEEVLKNVPAKEWTHDHLLKAFQEAAKVKGWKLGQLLWPLRVALTGRAYSPGAVEVAAAIAEERGVEAVMERITRAPPGTSHRAMTIQFLIPLGPRTTMKIGGAARYYAELKTKADVEEAWKFSQEKNLPLIVLGAGSNTVFADGIIEALVVRVLAENVVLEKRVTSNEQRVTIHVESGKTLASLINELAAHDLDLSAFTGIPGTLGGAIVGNAGQGPNGIWLDSFIEFVTVFVDGQWKTLTKEECAFSYRESIFKHWTPSIPPPPEEGSRAGEVRVSPIIWDATLRLPSRPSTEIKADIENLLKKRLEAQPHRLTAGSCFKAVDGTPAWKLIEAAGLRGMKVGGVQISEKHSNFLINADHGTFADLVTLIKTLREKVPELQGIEMRLIDGEGNVLL